MYMNSIMKVQHELEVHRSEVFTVLRKIESYATAVDEFNSAINCLENAEREESFWGDNVNRLAFFMAVNQPLYGLILSMMASLAAQVTYVRPATDTSGVVAELVKLLHIEDIFPNFHIVLCDRKAFMDTYVADADAVYFVGEYRNAKDVQKNAKSAALFMFSGTGMNPFVVTETADIQLAVKKAVQAGLYNSGQDCGRPKVYLVHANKATEFMNEMGHLLDQVVCDAYTNDQALVGPLLRDGVFLNAVDKLLQNRANIRYGGGTDITRRMIYPTILDVSLSQKVLFEEMFAPIFTVATYQTENDLKGYFQENRYFDNAMYVSLFGDVPDSVNIDRRSIIRNKNILDIEQGNSPFGGYGKKSNFVWDGSRPEARPFLVSEELYKFGIKKRKKNRR